MQNNGVGGGGPKPMCPDFHVTPQLSGWQGRHHSCRGLHPPWSARRKGRKEGFDHHGQRSLAPPVHKLRLRAPCVGRALRWGQGGTPAPCATAQQAACLPSLPSVLKGPARPRGPGMTKLVCRTPANALLLPRTLHGDAAESPPGPGSSSQP